MRSSTSEWTNESNRIEFFRVEPPPRVVFEEERLKATVHFSNKSSEFVGVGHWSMVYRVRMEHPHFTSQLKKKTPESEAQKEAKASSEVIFPFLMFYLPADHGNAATRSL
jgi:hypothetical protein